MPNAPTWLAPPRELPGIVPLEHFLVRRPDLAVSVPLIRAYSVGFLVDIEWCGLSTATKERLFGADAASADIGAVFGGPPAPSAPTFGVQLGDGSTAYDLSEWFALEPPPEAEEARMTVKVQRPRTGWDETTVTGEVAVWCQPLPTTDPLTLTIRWPSMDVDDASVILDVERITRAARRASSMTE